MPPPFRRTPARPRPIALVAGAVAVVLGLVAVAALGYLGAIALAVRDGVARTSGTVAGLTLDGPVRVVRDSRDVPHIRATSLHDAFFAQGYVTGSDRLFQIDVTRRYVYGRLSELLGSVTLATDERSRLFDPAALVEREYARLDPQQRAELQAYADGVNAAARREPRPPEYRALFASFEPWRPQDSLACGLATVRDLADGWDDVIVRDEVVRAGGPHAVAAFFPLTDPAYDTPTVPGPHAKIAPLPPLDAVRTSAAAGWAEDDPPRAGLGSNAFAAGAAHTTTGRALLANDPHLNRGIPGIWYLIDIAAPGYHVAGATLAGSPGVVLGHNEHIAWGATNGTVAGPRVFRERFSTSDGAVYATEAGGRTADERIERFAVRFAGTHTERYLRTRHGFVVESSGRERHAVQWDAVERPISALAAFAELGHAANLEQARKALAGYPGPTQNFVLADTRGRAAYFLAGAIPIGPWGLTTADGATTPARPLPLVPFARLPHVRPSRGAVIVTANNLQYNAHYRYRLSAEYTPPYRAAEIARRLRALHRFDPAAFSAIQADTESLAEGEFAQRAAAALRARNAAGDAELAPAYAALSGFDGQFKPESRGATVAERLRIQAATDLIRMHLPADVATRYLAPNSRFDVLMRALREHPRGWFPHDDPDAFLVAEVRAVVARYGRDAIATPYGQAYPVVPKHPLAAFGFSIWNGPPIPGQGGRFAPAVQGAAIGQSFRAVWDVGNWDAGGIDIPLGESGEPGSPHYRDLAARYLRHTLTPLPFSDAALTRDAVSTLVLQR
jgi:penicillin amidase